MPETTATENTASARDSDDPSKVPPDFKLPETPELTEAQSRSISKLEVEMEKCNAKYNLDCFSDSELNSESDEGEQYKYEHGYETLI